jgi:hypothetical protein
MSLLAACGQPVRGEKVDGAYYIIAADDPEDRHLSYDVGGGGIGIIEATVTGVGHNSRYITVERRPPSPSAPPEYYYIDRTQDRPGSEPQVIEGPFDATAFAAEQSRLDLPRLKPVH